MSRQTCRIFLIQAAALAVFAGLSLASNHHVLNGTWQLVPARSELHGEPAIQTGTVTINDREGNIYVQRNFDLDSANLSTRPAWPPTPARKPPSKSPASRAKPSGKAIC
jgi:hypothetical protein